MISIIMLIILVAILSIVLNKNSKKLKKEICWQHYLFAYLFILYLLISLQEVGFPSLFEWKLLLKSRGTIYNPHINLVPFKGFGFTDILNVILFMPFGFLLPTLWTKYRNFWSTVYYGLLFSFIIEISQLFVSCRETDITDLITNTIGTILGWVLFNIMKKVFYKLANKTAVDIYPSDTITFKLEPYLYIIIVSICTFIA